VDGSSPEVSSTSSENWAISTPSIVIEKLDAASASAAYAVRSWA
jgi:hypothetical protein